MGCGTDRGLEESCLPLLSQTITLAFDIDRDGMVEEPVENRRGDNRITKHVAPGAEALITGEQNRALLIAPGDELEEQIGALPINGDIPDLINDQELGLGQHLEAVLQPVFGERFAERREEAHGGRKQDAVALLTGRDAQGHGEMRLADAGRTEEQRILTLLQIAPGAEFADQFHINGRLDLKVEGLQRLLERDRAIANRIARCLSVLACTSRRSTSSKKSVYDRSAFAACSSKLGSSAAT